MAEIQEQRVVDLFQELPLELAQWALAERPDQQNSEEYQEDPFGSD